MSLDVSFYEFHPETNASKNLKVVLPMWICISIVTEGNEMIYSLI